MTRTCLVSLYSNGNVLAAISAVQWYNTQRHPGEEVNVVTIVNMPGLSEAIMRESGQILTQITGSQGWSQPIFLTDQDITEFVPSIRNRITYQTALNRFRQKIDFEPVDEIFYAHDIGGRVPGLAMNAYPEAERIIFGDGLGSIYNKTYHLALVNGASRDQARKAVRTGFYFPRRGIKGFVLNSLTEMVLGRPKPYQAEKAVLILPMDQTGNSLDNVDLMVVPKELVQRIITDCQKFIPELEQYTRKLLASSSPPYALILLENIADANLTTLEQEISLYEENIRNHIPLNATVFIKGHPLSIAPVDEMLGQKLGQDYYPKIISHEYSRYPIELWHRLVSACQVISIAYSNITLSYLYDAPAIYALNNSLIEKYIKPAYWDTFRDADLLYRGQLANLKKWDAQSILWKGSI